MGDDRADYAQAQGQAVVIGEGASEACESASADGKPPQELAVTCSTGPKRPWWHVQADAALDLFKKISVVFPAVLGADVAANQTGLVDQSLTVAIAARLVLDPSERAELGLGGGLVETSAAFIEAPCQSRAFRPLPASAVQSLREVCSVRDATAGELRTQFFARPAVIADDLLEAADLSARWRLQTVRTEWIERPRPELPRSQRVCPDSDAAVPCDPLPSVSPCEELLERFLGFDANPPIDRCETAARVALTTATFNRPLETR